MTLMGYTPFNEMRIGKLMLTKGMFQMYLCEIKNLPDAFTLALASSDRPSKTKANSMTGSSKKDGSTVRPGTSAERDPARNDVEAPRAMSEFMLGVPLHKDKCKK
jgi:hypothetical protein